MTPKHFVAVCLRLFALWLIISGLQLFFIASALKAFNTQLGNSPIWMFALVWSVIFLIAFILWIFSAPLATGLLSGVPRPQTPSLSLGDIIVAGCILLGLWWIKEALIPFLTLWFKVVALSHDGNSAFEALGSSGKISMALYLLEMTAGVFFVSRPFQIARWVIRRGEAAQAD
ncbi:hypothetical protein [Dyella choica]|uniref:DUF4149 domain-containing protein n=1 Tax=Dyella choica TaxID=1927959 RepID=A0A3S0PEX8_9GAMM|nr:hypothetical protein [Dyella choica]RUL67697.1 hypothetical protein EKH80_23650 [Dyella choica]